MTGDLGFRIPPREKNHEMRAVYVADQDVNVVSYFPHMHLRGKDMRMTATLPDGTKTTLLNVPAYDFNWQLFYYPKESVSLPRGARVDVVAHYDNSADNKHNPDPDRAVTFGEQVDRRDDVRAVRVHARGACRDHASGRRAGPFSRTIEGSLRNWK